MGHVRDVDASTVAHGADGQRQRSAHAGRLDLSVLAVGLPAVQSVAVDDPDVVGSEGSCDHLAGSETCERGVSDGPCFDEHSVVFTAQCKHLIPVAVHAKDRVLGLEETDAVLKVTAAAVPVRERPSLGGDVEAPPISGQCGGRVGRQLIESMRRHDLLRAGVDEADTWTVGATPVVAHEHGGRPGHGRGGCNEPPRGLAHEPVTGG